MRIFVTGATGFIGSNFVNYSLSNGDEVVGLKRNKFSTPRVPLLKEPIWLIKQLDDLSEPDFAGVDVVVHLAAHSMFPPYDTLESCIYWNVISPIRAFKAAIKSGVKKFVIAGSCFEYGLSGEEYEYIPVDAPLKPTLTYAVSKAASSMAFYQMAVENKLELSYHRIFHVYGEGESENRFWPSLKKAALAGIDFEMTNGEQVRDFIYVGEVVKKLYNYCNSVGDKYPIIHNLGTGNPKTLKDFATSYWKYWNAKGKLIFGAKPYRNEEVMRYVPLILE